MKKKLIKFIKKQLTNLQECVNINSNETRKDINMKKNSLRIAAATFAICILSIIVSGLSDHIGKYDEAYGTIQLPTNNPDTDNLVSVLPNDILHHMSAGANSAINSTIVVKPSPEEDDLGKEDVDIDNVGDSNNDMGELPDINNTIPPVSTPDTSTPINTYYCEWGDFYLTQEEYELFLTTVFCESGGEGSETQYMVALSILNRVADSRFPDDMRGVVYAKNAFSVTKWKDFENRGWTDRVEQSVLRALAENPHPRDMFYFRTGHYHSWAKDYKKVGKVYFSTRK